MESVKWCSGHQTYLPIDAFYFSGGKCKECQRAMARAHRAANLEKYRRHDRRRRNTPDRKEINRQARRRNAVKRKQILASWDLAATTG
jgi:hypothetical protein